MFVSSQFIITLAHTKLTRYERKNIQSAADVLQRLANVFDVSIDYRMNGTIQDKAESSLSDNDLLN